MPLVYLIYIGLRIIVHPFIFINVQIFPSLRRRWNFELKNNSSGDAFQVSFSSTDEKAQRCYHVSSEGEWEQAWPFILEDLREGLKTEVLYTSESLEKRVTQSKEGLDSSLIRFWRLPLLTYKRLDSWVSARDLVMCRYDFFPELILLGRGLNTQGGQFTLLSASLKNKQKVLQKEGTIPFVTLAWLYDNFDRICLASGFEKKRFLKLGLKLTKLWSYEARALQILWRLKNFRHTLEQRHLNHFIKAIEENTSKDQRLIFGSAWISDLEVLKNTLRVTKLRPLVVLAPHDLSAESIESLKKQIKDDQEVFVCDHETPLSELVSAIQARRVLILVERGILLELYPLFGHAYIGGGFGRSVHSVLEPYLATSFVYCGPKIHRSTEVELIEYESPQSLQVLESLETSLELDRNIAHESVAKVMPASYYEGLYEKELSKLKEARSFLFRRKD